MNRPHAGDLASRSGCGRGILSIAARRPTQLNLISDLLQNPVQMVLQGARSPIPRGRSRAETDRQTLNADDFAKRIDLLKYRPIQFCVFLKALVGAERMQEMMIRRSRMPNERNRRPPQNDIMISGDAMAQLVVRNLEDEVKRRLQRRASSHGRSMEEEVRDILRDALKEDDSAGRGLGTEIASLFAKTGLTADIPELRGHSLAPAPFDE
jgi:antitoxin FitA